MLPFAGAELHSQDYAQSSSWGLRHAQDGIHRLKQQWYDSCQPFFATSKSKDGGAALP